MKRVTRGWAVRMAARLLALEWYEEHYHLPFPFGPNGEIDSTVEEMHIQTWAWTEHNWLAFVHEVEDEDVRQLMCLINDNGIGTGAWRRRSDRRL